MFGERRGTRWALRSCREAQRWAKGCRRRQNGAVGRAQFYRDVLSGSKQGSLALWLLVVPNGEMLAIAWPPSGDSYDPPMRKTQGKGHCGQRETGGRAVCVQEMAGHCRLNCPERSAGESRHNSCWTRVSYTPSPFHRQRTEAQILNCVSSMDRRARCSLGSLCLQLGIL